MTPPRSDPQAPLSPEGAAYVEAVCDLFERAWKATQAGGSVPKIDGFLTGCAGPERAALLRQLVELDQVCRQRYGLPDRPDERPALGTATADPAPPNLEPRTAIPRAAELPPGAMVAHYRILERVGCGGMGVVYKAHDTQLGRPVALKFLAAAPAADRELLLRFQREARALSALNHPHICTTHARGEYEGRPFLVLEWVEGQTLRGLAPTLTTETLARLASQVAQALQAAHAAGIVHRDIKPDNIMVRADGYVKVLDFGLARRLPRSSLADPSGMDTAPGTLLGTLHYMSPEQARAEPVGPASDIFALGVVLYELATGVYPFTTGSESDVLEAIQKQTPAPPRQRNPKLPTALEALVQNMLAKDSQKRPSAGDVCAALDRLAVVARPRPVLRRAWLAGLALILALAVVLAVVFWVSRTRPGPAPATAGQEDLASLKLVPASGSGQQLPATGPVEGLAFSSDGRFLAAGNLDGGVLLWDSTGEAAPRRLWNKMSVRAVAFSRDGRILAAGDMGAGRVHLRDLESGREWSVALGFGAAVRAVAFAGGRVLAVGLRPWNNSDPRFVLIDVDAPERSRKPSGHTKEIWTVAVTLDGATIVTSAADGTVRIWAAATAALVQTIHLGASGISPSVAIAPDGRTLAIGHGERVELYDWGRWTTPARAIDCRGSGSIWAVQFAGPRHVITAGGKAVLWDTATLRRAAELSGADNFLSVAATRDGRRVALGSGDSQKRFVQLLELVPARD